jgi:hypothetical protein
MPKMSKAVAKAAAEAAGSSSFDPIPDGTYVVKLLGVDGSREGPSGPYWSWEFEVRDEEYLGRKLWTNTSLSEKAAWKLKEAFDAFGADLDTDTDELIGRLCVAVVSIRTIQQGARAGEETNQIERLKLADEQQLAAHEISAGGSAAESVF